jgi:hypothetical protein
MKIGDKVRCSHCGQDTVVKEKTLMDGWTPLGKVLSCAICGGELGEAGDAAAKAETSNAAMNSLKALLQAEEDVKPVIELEAGEGQFCKDCVHFVPHPFITRCGLFDRPTDPMDDCPRFSPKVET